MAKIIWDAVGARLLEAGVDHGVLYPQNQAGAYPLGVAWNGLTGVTESPSGAEPSDFWADNMKYASLRSAESFGATIEAFTYPDEFMLCDGSYELTSGVVIGQQSRKAFGLCYRTKLGSDVDTDMSGYKLHLVYGATASPSEKAYATVNESPDAVTFSWEITTIPVSVTGQKPTALLTIDSTKVNPAKLADLEEVLYGTEGAEPRLPLPDEIASLMLGTSVVPDAPSFVASTGVVTIPSTVGVEYFMDGDTVSSGPQTPVDGGVTIVITAYPDTGYYFPGGTNDTWTFISALED